MKILIQTYGRMDRQLTLRSLPKKVKENTYLVVQNRESKLYTQYQNVIVLPRKVTTLSPTRQWIIENIPDKYICLLDDDLEFFTRKKDSFYLRKCEDKDFIKMFSLLKKWLLSGIVHCGISAREGNNRIEHPYIESGRMMRVLCYDREKVSHLGCRFDRVPTKQDFDMTLQLLRKEYPNRISYNYANNQRGSQAAGGCAVYRTDDMLRTSSIKLKELHPEFVKVVEKETKVAWGGGVRTDVAVQWKKAFKSSGKSAEDN